MFLLSLAEVQHTPQKLCSLAKSSKWVRFCHSLMFAVSIRSVLFWTSRVGIGLFWLSLSQFSSIIFFHLSVYYRVFSTSLEQTMMQPNSNVNSTECTADVHFGNCIETLLACNIPQLQSDSFAVDSRLQFCREVASDRGPGVLVKLLENVLIEHGGLTDTWLPHNAEFYDHVLLH